MKYKVMYKTYGNHSSELSSANLNVEDEITIESKEKDLSFYSAMIQILNTKMAPAGYSSIDDYYQKTGDMSGGQRMVLKIPNVIASVMTDLYYAEVEKVSK